MRVCPKLRSFSTIVETQTESSNSQDSGSGQIGSLQLFNTLNAKTVSGLNGVKGLMYVEAIINGQQMQALVDTGQCYLQFHNGGGGLFKMGGGTGQLSGGRKSISRTSRRGEAARASGGLKYPGRKFRHKEHTMPISSNIEDVSGTIFKD
ncbi:Uncharacterized protein Fot_40018 [Forsythia ovata]|uniref:Uncharacterized protein n=1 Tax=Forsythia ovata TaxID=205694 RepID=A0ABD1S709_9LAMI